MCVVVGAGRQCDYSGKALVPGSCRSHFHLPVTYISLNFRSFSHLTPSLTPSHSRGSFGYPGQTSP